MDATVDLVVVAAVSTIVLLFGARLLLFIVQVFFVFSGFINVVTWVVGKLVFDFIAARLLDLIAMNFLLDTRFVEVVATRIVLEGLSLILEIGDLSPVLSLFLVDKVPIVALEVLSLMLEVVGLSLSLKLFLFLVALRVILSIEALELLSVATGLLDVVASGLFFIKLLVVDEEILFFLIAAWFLSFIVSTRLLNFVALRLVIVALGLVFVTLRLIVVALRLVVIALRLVIVALRLIVVALRLVVVTSRLFLIALRLFCVALRLQLVAAGLFVFVATWLLRVSTRLLTLLARLRLVATGSWSRSTRLRSSAGLLFDTLFGQFFSCAESLWIKVLRDVTNLFLCTAKLFSKVCFSLISEMHSCISLRDDTFGDLTGVSKSARHLATKTSATEASVRVVEDAAHSTVSAHHASTSEAARSSSTSPAKSTETAVSTEAANPS